MAAHHRRACLAPRTRRHEHAPGLKCGTEASRLGVTVGAVICVAVGFIVAADAGIIRLRVRVIPATGSWDGPFRRSNWSTPRRDRAGKAPRRRHGKELIFVLAVAGIILTILLSRPSNSTSARAAPPLPQRLSPLAGVARRGRHWRPGAWTYRHSIFQFSGPRIPESVAGKGAPPPPLPRGYPQPDPRDRLFYGGLAPDADDRIGEQGIISRAAS